MVKFSRTEVAEYITSVLGVEYGNVTLTIAGELSDGTPFEGTCTIKVLFPGDADDDGDVDFDDFTILARARIAVAFSVQFVLWLFPLVGVFALLLVEKLRTIHRR